MTTPNIIGGSPDAVAPEDIAPVVDLTDTTSDPTAPDEIVSETPVTVGAEAIDAARAIVEQEIADVRADRWLRSKRTLVQSALGAAAVAGFHAYSGGLHSWRDLAYAAGQAAATVVITYAHARIQPAK